MLRWPIRPGDSASPRRESTSLSVLSYFWICLDSASLRVDSINRDLDEPVNSMSLG